MKSIKEKSREYYRVIKVINEHESLVSTQGGDKFIEGANYVLGEIEKIIVNNEDNTLNMARCLVDCIEQLKK